MSYSVKVLIDYGAFGGKESILTKAADRIEELERKLAAQTAPVVPNPIEVLRNAMNDVEMHVSERPALIAHFTDNWNKAIAASYKGMRRCKGSCTCVDCIAATAQQKESGND